MNQNLCVLIHIITKGSGWYRLTCLSLPVFSTDRSKAVLLLWILFVIGVSCLSLLYCLDVPLHPCDHSLRKADLFALLSVMFSCVLSLSYSVSWVRCGK